MKRLFKLQTGVVVVFLVLLVVLTGLLFLSVVKSGYYYTLDNDEFHQSQIIYLLHKGFKPFTQIYLTVYPPIFHYVMMPFYVLKDFSFETIQQARGVMILLFSIRLVAVSAILGLLFNPVAAIIYLPLALLNPFTVYSEMQIRPDNLMITLFILGLLLATIGHKRKSEILFFLSSGVITFSLLTLMKIFPSVIAFYVSSFFYFGMRKQWKSIGSTIFGIGIAWCVFAIPFFFQGTFSEMINQVFIESIKSYTGVFEYPIPLGFFQKQDNIFMFGLPGKPVNWMWIWIVPLLGFAGLYQLFIKNFETKLQWKTPIFLTVFFAFVGQFGFLFYVESVFVQHYISLNWLMAFGAAVIFYQTLTSSKPFLLTIALWVGVLAFFGFFIRGSIPANEAHATIRSHENYAKYQQAWSVLPENEPVFPNMLFRPLVYPVPHNHFIGNMPDSILERLPSIPATLENNNTKYVYIDPYYLGHLKPEVQTYISTHYQQSSQDLNLFLRKP